MIFINFYYKCASCKNIFKFPNTVETYGKFIMHSKSGDAAYLDSFTDKIFDEVSLLFDKNKQVNKIGKMEASGIFQTIFGIACDPDANGKLYNLTGDPYCQTCGSNKMSSCGPTDPPEYVDIFIKPVTHEHWNKLSEQEKEKLIDKAITDYFNNKIIE